MSLNCKQGDLAVIVQSYNPENIGIIVKVIETHIPPVPFGSSYQAFGSEWTNKTTNKHLWVVESQGRAIISQHREHHHMIRMYADYALKPLRDNEGEDEMLRIAGKPEQLKKKEPTKCP